VGTSSVPAQKFSRRYVCDFHYEGKIMNLFSKILFAFIVKKITIWAGRGARGPAWRARRAARAAASQSLPRLTSS